MPKDTYPTPPHGWTCFHCGEHFPPTFKGQRDARHHFGPSINAEPMCSVSDLQYRAMEEQLRRYQEEDTELHRSIARLAGAHAQALIHEEEKGYARGLADARKYPETLGLKAAS